MSLTDLNPKTVKDITGNTHTHTHTPLLKYAYNYAIIVPSSLQLPSNSAVSPHPREVMDLILS